MKLPTQVLSHCLARGVALNAKILRQNLIEDKKLGFSGAVIVPALLEPGEDNSPHAIAQVFKETKNNGLVCGFFPGDGPNPLVDKDQPKALELFTHDAHYAVALSEVGYGPDLIVGPLHTRHRHIWDAYPAAQLAAWLKKLSNAARSLGLKVGLESLNPLEDGTPGPFNRLYEICKNDPHLGLHYDVGHAYLQGRKESDLQHMIDKVFYFEFANVGRAPLSHKRGIDFVTYSRLIHTSLPQDAIVGVEPFDLSVIKAFGLQGLCDTKVPGPEALALDADYLRGLGVME